MNHWMVGLQTCPREGLDLLCTLRSINQGGWSCPIVFGEPGTIIPSNVNGLVWPHKTGDWGGWYAALSFLHATSPESDYYVMFEDDIVIAPNVKTYVEKWIKYIDSLGCLCLYTPHPHRSEIAHLVTNEVSHGWRLWGAQAVVFTQTSLRKFLGSQIVIGYRDSEIGKSNAHKDALLGMWGEQENLGIFYHTPSLVQHLNLKSLIGNNPHQAIDFVGENTDVSTWGMPKILNQPADSITIF